MEPWRADNESNHVFTKNQQQQLGSTTNENRRRTVKEFLCDKHKYSRHLNLSFFGLLALVPQTTKALSRVFTTLSCSSFEGSKSSKQVISWLSRCRRASLLAVDCVASLEKLSECSRRAAASIWLMSPMLDQSIECRKPKSEVFSNARVQKWPTKVRSPGAFCELQKKRWKALAQGFCCRNKWL